jgi:ribosome maturation factor RimP
VSAAPGGAGKRKMEPEEFRDDVERLADESDLMVVDLIMAGAGRKRILRILVDRPGRVTVGECADLSRRVQDLLDSRFPQSGPYLLEVSSPGVGRELSTPVDWRRTVGRELRVELDSGEVFEAELADYDGTCLSFPDGRIVPTELIRKATEVI